VQLLSGLAMRRALTSTLIGGAAASGGGTIKLNWSDCGDSSTHGHITSLSPTSVTLGTKTSLTGKGKVDEAIPGATYKVVAKEGFIPIFSHTGDACKPDTIKLPAGAGELDMKGFKCPLSPGDAELDLDLTLSSSIPAKLARITIELTAETSSGDKALCVQIKTAPENLIADGEDLIADPTGENMITDGIEKKGVTIGGLKCDGIQTGSVFYPTDSSKTYPLLSFAHGWTEGGGLTDGNYKDVLETVAAAGYVVVAHHSGLVAECQPVYAHDQLRALAFIKETAEFSSKVDWSSKVGIYGHSMGGGATGDNAADSNAIQKYNIGAAVLLHPVPRKMPIIPIYKQTKIPTFFATGSRDTIIAPATTKAWSERATKPMIFAEMRGATHFECQSSEDGIPCPHGWTNYVVNWMNCYIKGMKDQCTAANAVCTQPTKPMTATSCQPGAGNATVVV